MHCVAQIDPVDLAPLELDLKIPKDKALVFFADTGSLSGASHRGAVREVPADSLGMHETDAYLGPLYGQDWASYAPSHGACSVADAPNVFPRWPIEFRAADQSATLNDSFSPSLDDLFGPKSSSVHLPLQGLVAHIERHGHSHAQEDAAPFPVRAAQMIVNHAVRLAKNILSSGVGAPTGAAGALLKQMSDNIAYVQPIMETLSKWTGVLQSLDPDAPLGTELGSEFVKDLSNLQDAFRARKQRLKIGDGTTITGGAALASYFSMYSGDRQSFEAIPPGIRNYIESERMRTAYSGAMTHQIGGFGANVQESEMLKDGKRLLLQVATDEAVGFMWGDVGVLQYWIAPEDLARNRWDKVEFLMHGH